jgi:hypothetical protein
VSRAADDPYQALVCVTTCQRVRYLRRYLPHFARACAEDPRLSLLVSLDGPDQETIEFCESWEIPLVHSEEQEGVGLAKNRALAQFPRFDYYFFIDDDTEVVDGSVFAQHIAASRASGIHHFSLFRAGGLRKPTHQSTAGVWSIAHGLYGGGPFSFFTGEGLRQVGGWHPRFAEFRRWGHTEHSWRFMRAGLAPAPFNVIDGLDSRCIWHFHPSVTSLADVRRDADQIPAPERELIDARLTHVPVQTLSPYYFNGVPFEAVARIAGTLDRGGRYPLAGRAARREARSDYLLWQYETGDRPARRVAALLGAAGSWPRNPMLRHVARGALRR